MKGIKKSKDCIISWPAVKYMVNTLFEEIKTALERGAKIRYIAHVPKGEKIPQSIQNLKEFGSFEVRSASKIPKAGLDIFDKKSVHIITTSSSNPKDLEVLRSNNPQILELAQDYFELKWQSAKPFC
jgi:nucleoid DNA-binding protein